MNRFVLIWMFFFATVLLYAQNTYSPYSYYGVGELVTKGFGQSRSMGNLGAAMRTFNQINYLNPASYTAQDTNSFMLDFGLAGYINRYASDGYNYISRNMNFNSLAMAFPVASWWKSSIGLVPYSRAGYNIVEQRMQEAITVEHYYKGYGGLNRCYIGNAVELFHKLSVGVNASYLFGYITRANRINFLDDPYAFDATMANKINFSDIVFNTGLQYYDRINDKLFYTIGVSYDPQMNVRYTKNITHLTYLSINNTQLTDTATYIVDQKYFTKMPASLSAGFSLEIKDKCLLGFEVAQQQWDNVNAGLFDYHTNNNTIAAGLEYIPRKYAFTGYFNRIRYRMGAHSSSGYLMFDNHRITDKGISVGLGLPFKFSQTTFNLSYERGVRGTTGYELIKENYSLFSVNLTFYDFWFFRTKID